MRTILKKFLILVGVLCMTITMTASALDLLPRFGNYGGKPRAAKPEVPFDIQSTDNIDKNTRWFPSYIRWAPDDSHLLVSLCHVKQTKYCRIGKYWIADKRWELLNLKPRTTYLWPSYSPDGKQIVAVVAPVNDSYRFAQSPALYLLSADGKQETKLIDTIAEKPSFSGDGKKIIYWRMTGGGGADVAMFDLTAGKEQMLTELLFWGSSIEGAAFFLPDGKHFVFSASLSQAGRISASTRLMQDGKVVRDERGIPKTDYRLRGTRFDMAGPNKHKIIYAFDMRNGPVTSQNITQMALLWPDDYGNGGFSGIFDVTRDGQVLYKCPRRSCYGKKLASGTYRANKAAPYDIRLYGKQHEQIFMLRPAREDSLDSAAFEFTGQVAAISSDRKWLALIKGNPRRWHFKDRIGIIRLLETEPKFFDWPRLNLDPAAMQAP